MMFRQRIVSFIGTLAVILATSSIHANLVPNDKEFKCCPEYKRTPGKAMRSDFVYQDDEIFKREISNNIKDLSKNEGKVFDRILMVNSIHRQWKRKYQLRKRELNSHNVVIFNMKNENLLFEGDIVMHPQEIKDYEANQSYRRKRKTSIYRRKHIWPMRKIPYYLDPRLPLKARQAIQKAIDIIHSKTCVRWVPYTSEKNYVHFKKDDGCFSTIGRAYTQPGGQTLSIGEGCEWYPIVLHEMTHCMGLFHEQSRNDRNKYITILWENIPVDLHDQFGLYEHGKMDKTGKNYDPNSLMHYSPTAFAKNGNTTIVSLDSSKTIGDVGKYTDLDILGINALYDCQSLFTNEKERSWSPWSTCNKHCNKERQRLCYKENQVECPKNTNKYGITTEYAKCSSSECPAPVNGNWGTWSLWRTDDEGKRKRNRQCNRPAPRNGGKVCTGESEEYKTD